MDATNNNELLDYAQINSQEIVTAKGHFISTSLDIGIVDRYMDVNKDDAAEADQVQHVYPETDVPNHNSTNNKNTSENE